MTTVCLFQSSVFEKFHGAVGAKSAAVALERPRGTRIWAEGFGCGLIVCVPPVKEIVSF